MVNVQIAITTLKMEPKKKFTQKPRNLWDCSATSFENYCYKIKQNTGTKIYVLSRKVDINIVLRLTDLLLE